jgi:hypothetical protein
MITPGVCVLTRALPAIVSTILPRPKPRVGAVTGVGIAGAVGAVGAVNVTPGIICGTTAAKLLTIMLMLPPPL